MTRTDLASRVLTLLKRKSGCVVLIKGGWGTGKTYFWRNFLESDLRNREPKSNKTAYVSLFGKKDIETIQADVLMQLFSINRHTEKVKAAIGSVKTDFGFGDKAEGSFGFGIAGSALSLVLNLLEKNTFDNITLCVDDFERKDECLRCVELIGYASILSERHGCNIVLLLDEEKLSPEERKDYDKYKEKFVDYEFCFDVNQDEVVDSILIDLQLNQRSIAREVLYVSQENNIRIIKKSVEAVVGVNELLQSRYGKGEAEHVAQRTVALVCIYHALGINGLDRLREYPLSKFKDKDKPTDEEAGIYYSRLAQYAYGYSEFDSWIWKHITGQGCTLKQLKEIIATFSGDFEIRMFHTTVFEMLDAFLFDLSKDAEIFVKSMVKKLQSAPRCIVSVLNYSNFKFLIHSMKEISEDYEYWSGYERDQSVAYVKDFFLKNSTLDQYSLAVNSSPIALVCAAVPEAKADYDLCFQRLTVVTQTHDEVSTLLDDILRKSGWNQHVVSCLNELNSEFIVSGIQSSPKFFESLVCFLRWVGDRDDSPFKTFRERCLGAIEQLGEAELGKFRHRRAIAIATNTLGTYLEEN